MTTKLFKATAAVLLLGSAFAAFAAPACCGEIACCIQQLLCCL